MNWPSEYKYRITVIFPDEPTKPIVDQLHIDEDKGRKEFFEWMCIRPECIIKLTKCIIDPNTKRKLDMEVLKYYESP